MRDKNLLFVFIAFILIVISVLVSFVLFKPASCWDKYQTEVEAIAHCEEH
jgi:uncharacterized membrane protein YgaE (UPF0421/DUF939 family)